jgi:hypothetical protein
MPDAQTNQKMGRGCFAYTPNGPAAWKLPLCDNSGKLSATRIGGAAAALSPGGFRGQKADIPSSALSGVKAKIRSAWRKANPDKPASEMPESIKP